MITWQILRGMHIKRIEHPQLLNTAQEHAEKEQTRDDTKTNKKQIPVPPSLSAREKNTFQVDQPEMQLCLNGIFERTRSELLLLNIFSKFRSSLLPTNKSTYNSGYTCHADNQLKTQMIAEILIIIYCDNLMPKVSKKGKV